VGFEDEHHRTRERALGMDRPIARRDFLNGMAVGLGGALAAGLVPGLPGMREMLDAAGFDQDTPGYYPPALTGMRGSHEGSYTVAHALRDGRFAGAAEPGVTGESYDLVVVGGGISGLAAAYLSRENARRASSSSTITTTSAATPSATNSGRAAVCGSPTAARRASNRRFRSAPNREA
jgi:hypothetical protein